MQFFADDDVSDRVTFRAAVSASGLALLAAGLALGLAFSIAAIARAAPAVLMWIAP